MFARNKRSLIKLRTAQQNVFIVIVSFALSVTLTRLYLDITGYPQIGNEFLHIAHALWGGLLLFIGAMLPIMFANIRLHRVSAALIGIGVGLFIDEVGKLITQNNDYFSPLAAPIIYLTFLLTIVVYLWSRFPDNKEVRAEMYDALVILQEVIDQDVDPRELQRIKNSLEIAKIQTDREDLRQLADHINNFLESDALKLIPHTPSLWDRFYQRWLIFEQNYIGKERFRLGLFIANIGLAWYGLGTLLGGLVIILSPTVLEGFAIEIVQAVNNVRGTVSFSWYMAEILLEGLIGILFVLATLQFMWRRDDVATRLGTWGLTMYLTTVGIITFYFDQFQTILVASGFFILLLLTLYYRKQYLDIENKALVE